MPIQVAGLAHGQCMDGDLAQKRQPHGSKADSPLKWSTGRTQRRPSFRLCTQLEQYQVFCSFNASMFEADDQQKSVLTTHI